MKVGSEWNKAARALGYKMFRFCYFEMKLSHRIIVAQFVEFLDPYFTGDLEVPFSDVTTMTLQSMTMIELAFCIRRILNPKKHALWTGFPFFTCFTCFFQPNQIQQIFAVRNWASNLSKQPRSRNVLPFFFELLDSFEFPDGFHG